MSAVARPGVNVKMGEPGRNVKDSASVHAAKNFLAGSVAAVAGLAVGHPLDTIRVRMQTSDVGVYRSATDCFVRTIRNEGVAGLYRGFSSPLFGITILKSAMFGTYGYFISLQQRWHPGHGHELPSWRHGIAGAGAGLIVGCVSAPVDRVKILLQTQRQRVWHGGIASVQFTGPIDIIRKLGTVGLFQGVGASMARETVGTGTYFFAFHALKHSFKPELFSGFTQNQHAQKVLSTFVAGGLTGMATWTVMFPIDVVKSRVQAQAAVRPDCTYWQVIRETFREGGLTMFYKGWRPTMLRAFPAHATILLTYELAIKFLDRL
eukprot:TRINITY_DN1139_c0_g2_i1.p1 TRINITY_DN1139_c0_g2~~TRINITY_DN1139_c0_g2_i1.p1  ORF type:complete len:320 (+),score=90.62 TRINITY_DN1139_c0_g2_i1:118-1077(+)